MSTETQDIAQFVADLGLFTGTEQWFRHPLCHNFLYTDGVKYFAEHCGNGAYWLLDIIATEVAELQETEEFLSIQLIVDKIWEKSVGENNAALITVSDGNGNDLYEKVIEYTDAPVGVWKFYLTNNVMLLPSEY